MGRWPWKVGAVGVIALAAIHGTLIRANMENDLTSRARAVLDQADAEGVTVEFVGRDGTLRGDPPAGVSEDALAMRVRAVTGARVVSFAGANTASGTGTSASSNTLPTITAGVEGDRVTLRGTVPGPQAAQELGSAIVTAASGVIAASGGQLADGLTPATAAPPGQPPASTGSNP